MMDIQHLNENACNHEETRAALRAANANFAILKATLEHIISDIEKIKRTCPRPT
jgi:hypothetical protein